MADYDKYYETENLFGEPYVELVDFFENSDLQAYRKSGCN